MSHLDDEVMCRGILFRDEDDAYEHFRQREVDDEAQAYRDGMAAGIAGLGTAGRDEDNERAWLDGYTVGLAKRAMRNL